MMMTLENPIIHLHQHPIVSDTLATLRNVQTTPAQFRTAMERVAHVLFTEATRRLPTVQQNVLTPIGPARQSVLHPEHPVVIVPILRAGLAWLDVAQRWLPNAQVHMMGLARNAETLTIEEYYNTLNRCETSVLPPEKAMVLLLDPMLATGNSLQVAVERLLAKGFAEENIIYVALLASPEGVEIIHNHFPRLTMVLGCIDERLNEKSYIVPGLGDAGDRYFNTPH
ncbi:MAG: uracil phosphoribosyltransferase [Vampirovibrionales bacterium]